MSEPPARREGYTTHEDIWNACPYQAEFGECIYPRCDLKCKGRVQMSVGKAMLFEQMARDEAARLVQARMDRIDGMSEDELRVLLRSLDSHIEALDAEKQYALGRIVELTPSYEED